MTPLRVGPAIALAAILVQAPRLVLALLAADRQPVNSSWERGLVVVAGIGTAAVLTGGNLYLAHVLATSERWRRAIACLWVAALLSCGGLVLPLIVAGLRGATLPQLVQSHAAVGWTWSVLASLAHELIAAGCILATAAAAGRTPATEALNRELNELVRSHDASQRQLAAAESRLRASDAAAIAALPLPCREGCGKSFRSELAEIGHLKHCPVRRRRAGDPRHEAQGTGDEQ